jgi:aryl-alcohol dehydrogenase-like predicted oxidoreductase
MKYRVFGRTGWLVSEIGFGAWGLGGDAYGRLEERVAWRTVARALECGINFFDTADLYGAGQSEAILGRALGRDRDDVFLATKVGTLPHRGFFMPQDFSPAHLEGALAASLKRLRMDHVDLLQLHSPDLSQINLEAALSVLESLQRRGLVRAWGISARTPADARRVVGLPGLASIQVNFNLIDHRALDNGLFDFAQAKGVAVVARTPLCFGYLTGQLKGDERFEESDHRNNWPSEQLRRWAAAPQAFAALYGPTRTATQLALKFALQPVAVSTVIPGMMDVRQVEENAAAPALAELTPAEWAEVRRIYQTHTFYDPTIKQRALSHSPTPA